jgi:hypothetical protein
MPNETLAYLGHDYRDYFKITGLERPPLKGLPPYLSALSIEMARLANKLTWRSFTSLLQGDRLPADYFNLDENHANHLNFSEMLSNLINEDLLEEPVCEDLKDVLDQNLDHGYNHIRRVEKWYKTFYKNDKTLRSDIYSLYFAPSAYLSMRFHDLVEVSTKKKDGHDTAAGLFALGYLSGIAPLVIGASDIPSEDWEKLTWGTAFICQHHSKPEKSLGGKTPESILEDGLLDPKKMLESTEDMAKKAGFDSIYSFFPPLMLIRTQIENIASGNFRQSPWYSRGMLTRLTERDKSKPSKVEIEEFMRRQKNEIQGLVRQTFLFTASDKLDGLYPADLSTSRTVLTRPERVFYAKMGEYPSLSDEYEIRKKDGGGQESACDLNRLLFEISRTGAFTNISSWLSFIYSYILEKKGEYLLRRVIPGFLNGDFRPYLDAYDNLQRDTVRALLLKGGIESDYAAIISTMESSLMLESTRRLVITGGYSGELLDRLVNKISEEKEEVSRALEQKYKMFVEAGYDERDKEHILQLVNLAVDEQKKELKKGMGSLEDVPPFSSYYAINLN